jgi:hypothetical protein
VDGFKSLDVGGKTTLRFQNRDRSGFAEVKGEICVVREGKWYKGQNSKGKCRMEQMPEDVAGGVLNTSTRPTFNR